MKVISPSDFREVARRRLPKFLFEYIDGGAYSESTLRRNILDLEQVQLRQRVLRDVSNVDLSVNLFGNALPLPIALAPIGLAGISATRGEVQAARAAEAAGIPFCLSTVSVCSVEEVAAATKQPFWFQLYVMRDRGFMTDLLAKVREAGCSTLVFTVDMPVPSTRYRDYRSGLAGAPGIRGRSRRLCQAAVKLPWAWSVGLRGRPHSLGNVAPLLAARSGLEDFFAWMRSNFDPTVTWRDLASIRSQWTGTLIIKGIIDPEDAAAARAIGADGIVVSNHGGRQLDGVSSTACALAPIADRFSGELAVLVDGGIRSGLDVVRMIALGARAVLVGRPWVYALAAAGQAGVTHLLRLMETEMRVAMALTGVTRVAEINQSLLAVSRRDPLRG